MMKGNQMTTDELITEMQVNGWFIMSAFCDRNGVYDVLFRRWDNGDVVKAKDKTSWGDAIYQCYRLVTLPSKDSTRWHNE